MDEMRQQSLSAIDLSQSMFRGSGALYQTDRLTLGRTKGTVVIPGKDQVIEKLVYVKDEGSAEDRAALQSRLDEALVRLLLTNVEREKLARELNSAKQEKAGVFYHDSSFEVQQLKTEIDRMRQLLQDQEREIKYVKEAEIRKSALQSGDLSLRLQLVAEENKRLQSANNLRISQINVLTAEVQKVRDQETDTSEKSNLKAQLDQLQKELQLKTNEIKSLRDLVSNFEKEKAAAGAHLKQLMKELNLAKSAAHEASLASEDLFRINQHLERELEKAQVFAKSADELKVSEEQNLALRRSVEGLQAANLILRDELARQAVDHSEKEKELHQKSEAEKRKLWQQVNNKDREVQSLLAEVSALKDNLRLVYCLYLRQAREARPASQSSITAAASSRRLESGWRRSLT
jgi:hypothetical protein